MLTGCASDTTNLNKAMKMQSDYDLLIQRGKAIYNSDNGKQNVIPVPHNQNHPKMMLCSQVSGIFVTIEESELREVADEFLTKNKPGTHAGAGEQFSGERDSRPCWAFEIIKK